MLDFLMVSTRSPKRGVIEIYPKFIIKKSSDLMIRGSDFYAVWVEERGLWSTDEQDALQMIDQELDIYEEENSSRFDPTENVRVLHMWDSGSGMIDQWHKYCQRQMRDSFHMLDEKLIFSNMKTTKEDYASKKLSYPLEPGDLSAYDKLMSTLYSDEERHKIEWAIGSIVQGDSKKLQKFVVLYGAVGTGKSTVINIVEQLFDGYFSVFDAKALGSSNNSFALEAFKSNPLVAIQHDGDLSHIEDNTRLNSLVSHEVMTVNEKFKSAYSNSFKCFIFMGTNKPVRISDAKSGLIRRLIDVSPTGNRLPTKEYSEVVKQISFELGAIAYHCRDVYNEDPSYYDDYIPINMLGASNDFYNFVLDSFQELKEEDGITLKAAWELYKSYCDEAKVGYPFSQRIFKEELKNYFHDYFDRYTLDDGTRVRSYYSGFITDKFEEHIPKKEESKSWIIFDEQRSLFDEVCKDCPAQYAVSDSRQIRPEKGWDYIQTKLSDLDTSRVHYVKVPENHIVIDFDILDDDGNKSFKKNLDEASKWPETYAELSKSGTGIHLHYIYTGDVSKLARTYADHIEVKVYSGKSALRRKLSKCNNLPIATISSGLPLKGEKRMVNTESVKSEKSLRNQIKKNLNKEIHAHTKPSVDFIFKILEDAYNSDLHYDVTDMRPAILAFAANSTNNADYCIKLVNQMHFKSKEPSKAEDSPEDTIIFFDVEVFPNLFLVNWKAQGEGKQIVREINPSPEEIEELMKFKLVGFNCRRYDNHILYARSMGYSIEQLYDLSSKITSNDSKNCYFGEAFNLSYTDIYDFCSKKQSLKKWEIELGIHHQELGIPWNQPVPEDQWSKVSEYCDNDVLAAEAVFNARQADFTGRKILADLAGLTVNDTTNTLTGRIIFGNDRRPQDKFNYRKLGSYKNGKCITREDIDPTYCVFNEDLTPVFPGYIFENGKSYYRGEEVGEGGYVYAEPGMYGNVALLDVASMHPSSIIAENLFGDEYTARFKDILDARIAIKHGEFDKARNMLGGKLAKYLTDEDSAADLAQALKIAINSVYGLTAASFDNLFKDPRNEDNIVAKRGALFMVNLKYEIQKRGYIVAHIKTDSIKIPDATPEIIQFVMDYGKLYGYTFEHQATYNRMCLVNDAVYISKYATKEKCIELYGEEYVNSSPDIVKECKKHGGKWNATGTQFQIPYVFKKLFSHEEIQFKDLCETKSVNTSLYLDLNEKLPDVSEHEKELKIHPSKEREAELRELIAKGHDYHYIGKVGQFCPMKDGSNGGILLRESNGRYYSVTGTKGYRWLESEMVETLEKEDDINKLYYEEMVNEAVDTINKYGNFDWFVSDDPYFSPSYVENRYGIRQPDYDEVLPF